MWSFRAQDGSDWTKTDRMATIFLKHFAASAPSVEGGPLALGLRPPEDGLGFWPKASKPFELHKNEAYHYKEAFNTVLLVGETFL